MAAKKFKQQVYLFGTNPKSSSKFIYSALNVNTYRSFKFCGAIAIPLSFGRTGRQYAGPLVRAKPIGGCFLLHLTIRFGFVFAKQASKVSATGSAIAIVSPLVGRMLGATRAVLTVMAVRAGSNRAGHD